MRDRWALLLLLLLILWLVLMLMLMLILILILRDLLASLVNHLLFLQRVRDHGGLPGKVEVLANRLLRRRAAAKGIVVEVIGVIVELVAEAVVGLFEVDAGYWDKQ